MRKMTGDDFSRQVTFFHQMAKTSWMIHLHEQIQEQTRSWKNQHVLDIGCATGELLRKGVEEAASITGVDLSEDMVKKARVETAPWEETTDCSFLVADAYSLPFSNQTFDISLSTLVMFLLPEPKKGLQEMGRVMKPNGISVLLNPSPSMNPKAAEHYADKMSISGFEREALIKWSGVATQRHRFQPEELGDLLYQHGAEHVEHSVSLGGLALLTKAEW
ncbi:Methyltransferase domain-containing protein [Alteribacillus persepolensis]|uniref:Methyltransferase domain-containing protein n=1 Tax=Alteribacillus persepolensis TaxID=568899 RepID=A0A1G7YHQ6_9BACI|nr:class I SAM-dependent methyltransferase [Alteribacillus persepolensis]SDG96043.1 Methyltransferase domain-containing protein [Alteribacillus persepolensis]